MKIQLLKGTIIHCYSTAIRSENDLKLSKHIRVTNANRDIEFDISELYGYTDVSSAWYFYSFDKPQPDEYGDMIGSYSWPLATW